MPYKILVTGATGFIGRHLVPKLVDNNEVYIITRDIEKAKKLYDNTDVKILQGNMNDIKSLTNLLKFIDFEYVINTVGGGPLTSNKNMYSGLYQLNVQTLKNLIWTLEETKKDIKLFVHISSLAAMGALNPVDIYDENTICKPVLPYEIVKYESEKFLLDSNNNKFKILIFRPPQIYGTESREILDMIGLIKRYKFPIFSKGIGSLPLINVEDFTDTIKFVIQKYDVLKKFDIYLVCGENYRYNEIIDMVRNSCGYGGSIKVPYNIAFIGIGIMERIFHLLNKIEPINTYRLNSICKNRQINTTKFKKDFNIEFRHNLQELLQYGN